MTVKIPEELNPTKKGFLFDPYTGHTYTLNATAAFVFKKLQEGKNISDITKVLADEYKLDEKKVLEDIKDFVMNIKDFNLTKK
ncbi:MAG: PqqD family protein [Candidatus Firestonebacteria bacterium]